MRRVSPAPLILAAAMALPALAANKSAVDLKQRPLVLASQGSFFVGGESRTIPPAMPNGAPSEVTINHMYVPPAGGGRH